MQIRRRVMMMKMKMKNCDENSFLPVINIKLSSITLNFNEVSNKVDLSDSR
jgi:hypothetical protein